MSDPFVAEIRLFTGNFAPTGWAFCNGQLMPISSNTALYALLGTTYGGDGISTFALPNLQGRVPIQAGQGPGLSARNLGEAGGETVVTLTDSQLPRHDHAIGANWADGLGTTAAPAGNFLATPLAGGTVVKAYSPVSNTTMAVANNSNDATIQPHNNIQPYLAVNFIIALQGIFPSRP